MIAFFKLKSEYFKNHQHDSVHKFNTMIYKNHCIPINFFFYELGNYDSDEKQEKYDLLTSSIEFDCYFQDCYKNWYKQSLTLSLFHEITKDALPEDRALNISISDGSVISPPILIKENELPWNNGKKIYKH